MQIKCTMSVILFRPRYINNTVSTQMPSMRLYIMFEADKPWNLYSHLEIIKQSWFCICITRMKSDRKLNAFALPLSVTEPKWQEITFL